MADKLPPGHSVDAHKDKMGKVMHEWKHGTLHSGTGKEGKKGPKVKSREQAIAIGISESKHAERLMAMGYSEEAASAIADFIESQKAADEVEQNSATGDIDARPGKQKPLSKPKQEPQGSAATFPTLPKSMDQAHAEGPFIAANKRQCPRGTLPVGAGFCKNPKPGKRQYFEVQPRKHCPPNSRPAGRGMCMADYAEGGYNADMPPGAADNAINAIQNTPCKKKKDSTAPKAQVAKPTGPTAPTQPNQPVSPERQRIKDAAKKRAQNCAKQQGN